MARTKHTTADALLTAFAPFLSAARDEFGPSAARFAESARPALASLLRTLAALLRLLARRIDRPAPAVTEVTAPVTGPITLDVTAPNYPPAAPPAGPESDVLSHLFTPDAPAEVPTAPTVPYGWASVDLPPAPTSAPSQTSDPEPAPAPEAKPARARRPRKVSKPAPAEPAKVWTLATIAKVHGVPVPTLKRHCQNGTLAATKGPDGWVVVDAALAAYLEARRTPRAK